MRRATIFVLSDNRSGSTLLDQCLGGHSAITSLGEVHWLDAYVAQDRRIYDPAHELLCTCGQAVAVCPFWTGVERALGRPLGSLALRQRLNRPRGSSGVLDVVRHLPRRFLRDHPGLYRNPAIRSLYGGGRLARDCVDLYDAVCNTSGRPFCVDSSKTPYRFRDVQARDPDRTVAVVLCRDFRAVVYSKMKRGQTLGRAAYGWHLRMRDIRVLTEDLPRDRIFRLSYEALCEAPERELDRLARFLDVPFEASMLQRATSDVHHIGGSPSKFDPGRIQISLDRSHEDRFSSSELAEMRRVIGDEAGRWGY